MPPESALHVGIDLGTSGCRAVAIDAEGNIHAEAAVVMPLPLRHGGHSEQDPAVWWVAVRQVLSDVAGSVSPARVCALAVDGTSGTLLLTDGHGAPLGHALMYDDNRAQEEARRIAAIAPPDCAAHGTGSALAKLLYLQRHSFTPQAHHAIHQADWIIGRLSGRFGISDDNNCLKLGYDPVHRCWPAWLGELAVDTGLLPAVVRPGTAIGTLQEPSILALGFSPTLRIVTGTTDSVAAFIATGAHAIGDAVTSLGSTVVLKVLCPAPVFSPAFGVYSHPLGDLWLAGGGSNSGGAVLLAHFSVAQLEAMTPLLHPDQPTGLDYYPLRSRGERFPYNDPALEPRLTPRPADDTLFLQGMLEGMTRIEALGYQRLAGLGAPYPYRLMTVGGGARNPAWTRMRERALGVPLESPRSDQASYGTAMLALRGATWRDPPAGLGTAGQ